MAMALVIWRGSPAGSTIWWHWVSTRYGCSPLYPSPMVDFGYDVANYCDVDPRFGTLAELDRLIAAAHARGLRLLLDLVPNHSSDQHPWFRESRSSRASPKRDCTSGAIRCRRRAAEQLDQRLWRIGLGMGRG